MAYTGDSNAPLKDIKRTQFGILGPDELVRCSTYHTFVVTSCHPYILSILFHICVYSRVGGVNYRLSKHCHFRKVMNNKDIQVLFKLSRFCRDI